MDYKIVMYTDGSCIGNPGPGGYCAILTAWGQDEELVRERVIKGGDKATTNNIMEMTAVIEGLKSLSESDVELTIISDSQYVKNGIETWINNWKKNGWKTAKKQPVKNKALWVELDRLVNMHRVNWEWTKGHAGHEWNEKADDIARDEAEQLR